MNSIKKVRDAVKQNTAADTRLLVGMLGECSCTPTTPDEALLVKEMADFLRRTLMQFRMSEQHKEICRKVFFDGETQADVARELGIRHRTVSGVVSRARVKLARALSRMKTK